MRERRPELVFDWQVLRRTEANLGLSKHRRQ